jgi:5'-nucleotidase
MGMTDERGSCVRVLVTNDDGIASPGLLALATAVSEEVDEVRIVAPDRDHSSGSHAVTTRRPVRYGPARVDRFPGYAVDGTPADCVTVGKALWPDVQMVVSGINMGANVGHQIWHSATVGAARQAVLLGVPWVAALSLECRHRVPDLDRVDPWIRQVLRLLRRVPEPSFVNVNIPDTPKGIVWCQQDVSPCRASVFHGTDPQGHPYAWLLTAPCEEAPAGTDRAAIARGLIAITPLTVDLTERARLAGHALTGSAGDTSGRSA